MGSREKRQILWNMQDHLCNFYQCHTHLLGVSSAVYLKVGHTSESSGGVVSSSEKHTNLGDGARQKSWTLLSLKPTTLLNFRDPLRKHQRKGPAAVLPAAAPMRGPMLCGQCQANKSWSSQLSAAGWEGGPISQSNTVFKCLKRRDDIWSSFVKESQYLYSWCMPAFTTTQWHTQPMGTQSPCGDTTARCQGIPIYFLSLTCPAVNMQITS